MYVSAKTHQNRLKPIQPNFKKSLATLFVCKWGNHHAKVLRINVWPVGDCLLGAPQSQRLGASAPFAPPKDRPCLWQRICSAIVLSNPIIASMIYEKEKLWENLYSIETSTVLIKSKKENIRNYNPQGLS
jgi:hypothetical protein